MNVVGAAIAEELGQVHAAAIDEMRRLLVSVAADHMGNLSEGALLELHVYPAAGITNVTPCSG
jgi:hypothetical protein